MRYALLLAVALGIAPKLAGPTKAQPLEQRDAETIAVPIGTSVRVEIEAGSVTVRAWDRDELSIRSPDRSAYLAEYQAGAVLIRPGGESGSPLELELQVPRSADLAVDTGRARVDVTGVEGAVMVRTREGAVRGRDLGGKVNLSSESGRISYDLVRQPRGDIRLDSVEGQIECRIPNSVNFKTVVEAGAGWSWDREVRFGVGRLEKQLGSGGPTLHIGLRRQRDFLCLSVEDDGAGFGSERNRGFGLIGMQRRADSISATLAVKSTLGGGTRVEVKAPVRSRRRLVWIERSAWK